MAKRKHIKRGPTRYGIFGENYVDLIQAILNFGENLSVDLIQEVTDTIQQYLVRVTPRDTTKLAGRDLDWEWKGDLETRVFAHDEQHQWDKSGKYHAWYYLRTGNSDRQRKLDNAIKEGLKVISSYG